MYLTADLWSICRPDLSTRWRFRTLTSATVLHRGVFVTLTLTDVWTEHGTGSTHVEREVSQSQLTSGGRHLQLIRDNRR